MGDQGDGDLGLRERPPRAVGFRPAGVDKRAGDRRDCVAGQGQARVRSAVLDAEHGRNHQGQGVQPVTPTQPTKEELEAYLASVTAHVKDAVVLVGRSQPVPVNLEPPAKRTPDEVARGRFNPRARAAAADAKDAADGARRRDRPARGRDAGRRSGYAAERIPGRVERQAPDQRRRARARTDPRLPEQHLRHHQGRPDRRDAQ